MDYRDTAAEAEFRTRLREWLSGNIPAGWRDIGDDAGRRASGKQWHRQLYRAGYVGMSWPREYGGQGLSPIYDAILNEEAAAAQAPPLPGNVNFLGPEDVDQRRARRRLVLPAGPHRPRRA